MRSALKLRNDSDWSNEMQRFATKRNNQVDDYIKKSTKMVVDFFVSVMILTHWFVVITQDGNKKLIWVKESTRNLYLFHI